MSYISIFILGLLIGSFLNVCIYRLPRGESIVYPPSHCPRCNKRIRWFDNIPLISFILLGRRCRKCKEKILWRYFSVELITGFLFILLWKNFAFNWVFIGFLFFCMALIVITFIDLEFLLIPDVITYPGMVLGLLAGTLHSSFLNSIGGLLIGGGIFYIISLFGQIIIHREVLGGGDIKMIAMIGAFLGIINTFIAIFIASLIGAIVGITLIVFKLRSRKDVIPFGPFLSLGAVTALFWNDKILECWEKLNLFVFNKLIS